MLFAETVLQLVSREAKKEVGNIIPLNFDPNIEAGELCPHVKRLDDCKQIVNESKEATLA